MPTLIISHPGRGDVSHELAADVITVGAHPENTIRIEDPSVSAKHARLVRNNGSYRLEDLGSTNRCRVEGQEVAAAELAGACAIAFGNVSARYDASSEAAPELAAFEQSVAAILKAREALQQQNAKLAGERDAARGEAARMAAEFTRLEEQITESAGRDRQRIAALEAEAKTHHERSQHLAEGRESLAAELAKTRRDFDALLSESARFVSAFQRLASTHTPQAGKEADPAPPPAAALAPPADIPDAIAGIHRAFAAFAESDGDLDLLAEVLLRAYSLSQQTAAAESATIFNLASALEALVRDLHTVPTEITPGTVRSVGGAIELLGRLLQPGAPSLPDAPSGPAVHCLAENSTARGALASALESVNLRPTFLDPTPQGIAALLEAKSSLVLITESEAASVPPALRRSASHQKTPILLLTAAGGDQQPAPAGIDDVVPQAFNPHDLAVKALTLTLRSQLARP